jgi:glucose-6-phosphate-specific signal transduction histidine kinase
LQWLERIVRHLGQPLQNLFLLRHIRAHAIEGERSRISREIHDGILQTLLSVDIQLNVLRRKVPSDPVQAVGGSLRCNKPFEMRPMSSAAWSPICARFGSKAPIWWT